MSWTNKINSVNSFRHITLGINHLLSTYYKRDKMHIFFPYRKFDFFQPINICSFYKNYEMVSCTKGKTQTKTCKNSLWETTCSTHKTIVMTQQKVNMTLTPCKDTAKPHLPKCLFICSAFPLY